MGCLGMDTNMSKEEIIKKYVEPLKKKIEQLARIREQREPFICANGGDVCNNPCYEYQSKLVHNCPKCGGKVKVEYENGKTVKQVYNEDKGVYEDRINYDNNVCTKFNWVEGYLAMDVDVSYLLKVLTRRKNLDKDNWVEYMAIEGERFDAPPKQTIYHFLYEYDEYIFPRPYNYFEEDRQNDDNYTCLFYKGVPHELGQSLGSYCLGIHFVNIYTCLKCGHKYHIIRTSVFKYRDKSLDKYIDNPEEYQKLKNGNSEQKNEQK